ncbi:MAG: RluA family pseudouridine synthase [Planctomycetaceae bacterium]
MTTTDDSDDLSTEVPQELTVEARAHGWRVDHYLSRLYPNYSRALFQRAIQDDRVLVNGLVIKSSRRLRVNDRVSVLLPEQPDGDLQPENIPIDIVYEDEYIAVINKAADVVTHPGKANFTGTLAAAVQYHFDQLSDVAGQLRPGIVHRLDRDTTGVIVIAKDNTVHNRLTRQFEQRVVKKEYRAIVRGGPPAESDYVRTHVKVHPKVREKMIICGADDNGKEAVTFYRVLKRYPGFSYVQLLPETGRTHQLRVHMLHLKCPIIADKLYAGHASISTDDIKVGETSQAGNVTLIERQALHAHRLTLRHPVTEAIMEFEAPLPEDMQRTLDFLDTTV